MSTIENAHQQLHIFDSAIARLSEELRAKADKAKGEARSKLASLRAERDAKRLEIMVSVGAALISAQTELAKGTAEMARATGEAKGKAQAHLAQLEIEVAKSKHDLQAYAVNVTLATDAEIAMLETDAKTADAGVKAGIATFRDRLRTQRDAVARSAEAFAQASGARLQGAKQEFEKSMRELTVLRNEGAAGVN
ncbi:MAG: hypothetical protein JWO39_959 [Gemmatimonadetes bacterium]|nr:hypothetical protein [Gemmatimonadota bacterium]